MMEDVPEPSPFLAFVSILLRLPPLFAIDALLQLDLGIPYIIPIHKEADFDEFTASLIGEEVEQAGSANVSSFSDIELQSVVDWIVTVPVAAGKLLILLSGTTFLLGILTLWTKHLINLYHYLIAIGLMILSYQINQAALTAHMDSGNLLEAILQLSFVEVPQNLTSLLLLLLKQLILAECFWELQERIRSRGMKDILVLTFILPALLTAIPVSSEVKKHASVYASLVPIMFLIANGCSHFRNILEVLHERYIYGRQMIQDYGWHTFLETEWIRLSIPNLFRTFWITRCLLHAGIFTHNYFGGIINTGGNFAIPMVQTVIARSCDTNLAVLSMASVYSYVTAKICSAFQSLLAVSEEEDSFGTISAVLFVILAMQNGLTTLPPQKRVVRLFRNSCLLITCMLHFIHTTVTPVLMSLSTSRNPSISKHARALVVCMFLILFPASMIYALYTTHSFSTWLFAVTAFSVEVVIKVFISIAIYLLFMLDAKHEGYWEELDDYVYWVKSFGNAIEFIFGILLFMNGAFIMIFESGGAIRAAMICVHAYFNIWCEARTGWKVFVRRREAVEKICSLQEASADELRHLGDVCSICFHEMETARITKCKHYFHGMCLRKWLYVQDKCPMCHESLSTDPKVVKTPPVVRENVEPVDAIHAHQD